MPHIDQTRRTELNNGNTKPMQVGELCFLFAQGALNVYNATPSWTTIHNIRVALRSPYHAEWSHLLIQLYMTNWNKMDIETAADLAFLEFYRLVGSRYENAKLEINGNVFESAILPATAVVGNGLEPVKRKPGRPKKEEVNVIRD